MLLKKSAIAFLALFLLSGCGTSKKQSTTIAAVGHSTEYTKLSDFEKTVGDRVHFDYNKSELSDTAKGLLHKQACWLKRHSNIKATIEGHCDARGTREYNLALGEKRAEAVSQYLQSLGVDKSRLDTISYGKEKPAVIGDTEAAWSQNRRAVSVVK